MLLNRLNKDIVKAVKNHQTEEKKILRMLKSELIADTKAKQPRGEHAVLKSYRKRLGKLLDLMMEHGADARAEKIRFEIQIVDRYL